MSGKPTPLVGPSTTRLRRSSSAWSGREVAGHCSGGRSLIFIGCGRRSGDPGDYWRSPLRISFSFNLAHPFNSLLSFLFLSPVLFLSSHPLLLTPPPPPPGRPGDHRFPSRATAGRWRQAGHNNGRAPPLENNRWRLELENWKGERCTPWRAQNHDVVMARGVEERSTK